MPAQSGCIPITRYALSKLRAMGPYGATVYLTLLRLAPEYGKRFTVSHADLVKLSGTSYQTIRKTLGILADLELIDFDGGRVNGSDTTGMGVVLHRQGCGLACGNVCGKPVDKVVETECNPEVAVTCEDTALPTGLARASAKPQVKEGAVTSGVTVTEKEGGNKVLEKVDVFPTLENSSVDRVQTVFEAWLAFEYQGQKLTQHRGMTDTIRKAIVKALARLDKSHGKDLALAELLGAIRNYGTCLRDESCLWSYEWTLTDFLSRANGFERFLDEAKPVERERAAKGIRSAPKTGAASANGFKAARSGAFSGL